MYFSEFPTRRNREFFQPNREFELQNREFFSESGNRPTVPRQIQIVPSYFLFVAIGVPRSVDRRANLRVRAPAQTVPQGVCSGKVVYFVSAGSRLSRIEGSNPSPSASVSVFAMVTVLDPPAAPILP